jgi:hypothetical protein
LGSEFWVLDFGFWVLPYVSGVLDFGFWILDSILDSILGFGCSVLGFWCWVMGWFRVSGFGVEGLRFLGFGLRVWGRA